MAKGHDLDSGEFPLDGRQGAAVFFQVGLDRAQFGGVVRQVSLGGAQPAALYIGFVASGADFTQGDLEFGLPRNPIAGTDRRFRSPA